MTAITVADTAGFCFGVDRAIQTVYRLLGEGKQVCTLGPIIHNPHVVAELCACGVKTVDTPAEVPPDSTVVVRSHGVAPEVIAELTARGIPYVDATCPYVSKIHHIVRQASAEGRTILIAGDEKHPETIGIRGHATHGSYVFRNAEELLRLNDLSPYLLNSPVAMAAQTTFSSKEWQKCVQIGKKVYTNAIIFDTICGATFARQQEADALARQSDLMLIIGGRQSSNTAKLRDVCATACHTILIENADELPPEAIRAARQIGVTAGASTPAGIIKEVLQTMSEILNQDPNQSAHTPDTPEEVIPSASQAPSPEVTAEPVSPPAEEAAPEKSFEEMTFEEALEASLRNLNTSEKVRGVVVGISPTEVQVDVGRKQAGYIPISELSGDPTVRPEDLVKIGDELDLLIMRTNDQEGTIMLSKRRLDAIQGWEDILKAHEDDSILDGVVTDIIKGGVLAVTKGMKVFIPASQATLSRGDPLEDLLKKPVRFRIIEVNRGRRRAVGSIRAVAKELRKEQEEAFWSSASVGDTFKGVVKSLTSYGAFVNIGGVDGMIHISELSWNRIKHPSEVINIGDTVEVYIKDLDTEKKRISLGYRKNEENPWEVLRRDYPAGSIVDAKVVGMTPFGAFAQIIPGIDGLIHISQIADRRINKPQDVLSIGDVVKLQITDIDFDKKRISLSIRTLIDAGVVPPPEVRESEPEPQPAETPVEAAPEAVAEVPAAGEAPVEAAPEAPVETAPEAPAAEEVPEAPAEESPAE